MASVSENKMEENGVVAEKLPQEVMHDILSRLPVKNILQFRCVSKSWLHLLSFDPQFKKLHSQATKNSTHPPGIIALKLGKPKLYYGHDYTACDKAIEFDIPFNEPSKGHYIIIGICNGLISLRFNKTGCDGYENLSNVYVWNPLTGIHITIPCPPVTPMATSYGFGYDEGSDEYKVIRLLWTGPKVPVWVCVYTLESASWGPLDDIPYDISAHNSHVPLVNGALHWIATKIEAPFSKIFISFDIKYEVFKEISLPNGVKRDSYYKTRVGELNGILSVTYAEDHSIFQLWVMKEYGVHDSWIKQCEIKSSELRGLPFSNFSHFEPLGRVSDLDIIMRTGVWQLGLYNSQNSSINTLEMFKGWGYALFTYFGSFTSPKSCQLSQ